MIDALGLEIATIRKKGGGTQIELRGGERVGQAEGSWLYRFILAEDFNLRDDTPIRVIAGQEDIPGVLVSFRDGVLLVALEKDLGSKIALARLISNDSFLIERLQEKLQKIRSGEIQFNRSAANRALGLAEVRTADAEPNVLVLQDGVLKADQISAVRRSLGSDTTFVWGPPGTGKTTTLARIVEAHYRAGRSVLLVSSTNIAVDTALECVAEQLKGEPVFHEGLVIRQGPMVKDELQLKFGSQVNLEKIVERLGQSLRQEKVELAAEAAPIESEERLCVEALQTFEHLSEMHSTLSMGEQGLAAIRSTIATREQEIKEHQSALCQLNEDIERASSMNAVGRFLLRLNPEKLRHKIVSEERSLEAAMAAASALSADIPQTVKDCATIRAAIERLSLQTRAYSAESEVQARLKALRRRLDEIRRRVAAIDSELAELEQQVLARCRILATTVYRTYLGKKSSRQFDVVVVDEASMLMPPLVYYVAGLSTQSITIAGDFRQLPPIVLSDEPLASEWLKRDVFEIASIPKRLERRQPTPYLVALETQFRMRDPICAVINKLFYDGRLRSDPSVNRGGGLFPLGSAPLLFVDTAPFHPWTALRVGTYSRYNLFHALLIRNIVLHLAEEKFLPLEGSNEAVGAIAPYASQARLIQALLEDRLGVRAAGIGATVHRFQGNQKRAIIVDLTDSTGAPLGRFLQATKREEDGARLLNVAVSRAKHHVVLVGNFEYLRSKAPRESFVRQMVDHFEEYGQAIELDTLLPLTEREWIDGLHRVLPSTFDLPEGAAGAFTEGTFYPAFLKDLLRVRESVVIFSPFATGGGTGRWVDPLRAALARNVRVRILTRPPEEPGGGGTDEVAELVQNLRTLGITVDLRARMHEKIAILDGRILWHGSLNIFSHRDTHESMLRLESPAACQQLGRFVSAPTLHCDDAPTLDGRENPGCPKCGASTVWNSGRFGIWFECERPDCDGKVDARRRGARAARRRNGEGRRRPGPTTGGSSYRECPQVGCGGQLAPRRGRFGRFLGCTNYPACRYTEDVDDEDQ
jgi:ssDNA-binding Zn-finger/Zn-ribbon topoisomerase 1